MTTQLEVKQSVSQSTPPSKAPETVSLAKKVMIVEDESVISLDIKTSLMRLGYEVAGVAASGESALQKIRSSCPDVILMDIHLKGEMTGIDVSEKVRSEFQIPIVYLTANADSSTFKEANQTDPYGYLLKPFEERELGIAIEIALHKHQKEQVVRSSEHWYATAFQSLSEAVVATDRHGDVVFMNALAESITSWPLTEALDRPITDVLTFQRKIQQFDSIEIKKSVSSILGATLRGVGVVSLPHNARLLTRSLQVIPVQGQAVAMKDSTGYVTGSLFTFRLSDEVTAATKEEGLGVRSQPTIPSEPLPDLAALSTHSNAKENANKSTHKSVHKSANPSTKQAIAQDEVKCIKTLIESLARGESTYFSQGSLVASCERGLATLSSRTEGNIITSKLIRDNLTAVVNRNSAYWEVVCHVLIENSFFPVSQRTNGTCYFQHCTIPKDCQVYRTPATDLWEVWHGKACPGHAKTAGIKVERKDILVLRRGSWYHIQSIALSEGIAQVKTIAGVIFISTEDLMIWGTQLWH